MESRKKWYRLTYLQGRNSDTDTESGYVGTEGEGEGRINYAIEIDKSTLLCIRQVARRKLLCSQGAQLGVM